MWKFLLIGLLSAVVAMPATPAQQPPPSLTLTESPTVVASNGLVTATWATESNPTPTDWIGWYAAGAPVTSGGTGPAGSQWAYTGGMSNGSLTLPAPPPGGPYELRLYRNNSWILAATSNQFTVTVSSPPPPSLTLTESPTVVASNGLVTATWATESNPTPTDWIGWYAVGAPVASGGTGPAGSQWAYTGGMSNGSLTLPAPPPGGPYELRLYRNNSWILAATSNQFTVTASSPPPPSLTLTESPTVAASNGLVTATWATESNPTPTDWIGWYAVGAPVASGGTGPAGSQWAYTGGMSNGSLTLPAPPPGGPYELRLYRNNSWILAATSNQFTVANPLANPPPNNPNTIVLKVGPGGQYHTISAAVAVADADTNLNNYYDLRIMPATYTNDFPYVSRPMTIEVDPDYTGGPVVLEATVPLPNEKGIIVTVASLTVNGLTFTGAQIDNSLGGNGAGIRDQNTGSGATLMVLNSTFTGNQEGILTGNDADETISVTNSNFINNGNPNVNYFQHGLYVNGGISLTVSNSLFCGQLIGQDIKSRAQATIVSGNQLYDGAANPALGCAAGSSSLAIDIANGGVASISGNQIIQGAASQNSKMVDYGEEGLVYGNNSLAVSGNSFASSGTPSATAIYDPYCVTARLSNNTFSGITTIVNPAGCAVFQ